MKSDLIDIEARRVHATERAILIDNGGKENVWLPLAIVEVSPCRKAGHVIVTMPQAFAEEKGLV